MSLDLGQSDLEGAESEGLHGVRLGLGCVMSVSPFSVTFQHTHSGTIIRVKERNETHVVMAYQ